MTSCPGIVLCGAINEGRVPQGKRMQLRVVFDGSASLSGNTGKTGKKKDKKKCFKQAVRRDGKIETRNRYIVSRDEIKLFA